MNVAECNRFLKRKGVPIIPTGKDGFNELTYDYVVAWCEWNEQYSSPKLNEFLYLNFKGKFLKFVIEP